MALKALLPASSTCRSCRARLFYNFLGAIEISPAPRVSRRPPISRPLEHVRAYSQTPRLRREEGVDVYGQDETQNTAELAEISEDQELKIESAIQPAINESSNDDVPWYLKVNPPTTRQQSPLSERQRLPDLPENPPPILQPLLEQVSVDLGMDDLSLLDLRTLDPPPALGSNLLMIIGTARSEKHLHVSADRLCRWLRSNYKLSPHADGLLGRNELKLKLKRKAKRSKLMSAVGAKETSSGEADDGIRTGWVCVNLGTVIGGELKPEQDTSMQPRNIVGFGTEQRGSRIVVQMATDEKREELDLESLWNGILRRSKKRQEEVGDTPEGPRAEHNHGHNMESARTYPAGGLSNTMYRANVQPSPVGFASTSKALHTRAQRLPSSRRGSPVWEIKNETAATKPIGVRNLSPYLDEVYARLPAFAGAGDWQMELDQARRAVAADPPTVTAYRLFGLIAEMETALIEVPEQAYLSVMYTLLSPNVFQRHTSEDLPQSHNYLRRLMDLLENMDARGMHASTSEVLHKLQAATATPLKESPAQEFVPAERDAPDVQSQVSPWALRQAFAASSLSQVWHIWSTYPRRFLSRSAAEYTILLDGIAGLGDRIQAIEALRTCMPSMPLERPTVELEGEVARAALRCLELAEPNARELGENGSKSEWALLWRRIQSGLTEHA